MIISYENKYIFVANPKTATTSIQSFLLSEDKSAKKNWIEINGVKYKFREHYTASEIREVLGELYNEFTVFGFVRNPYDKVVSSYHFYKNGKPITKGHKSSLLPIKLKMLTSKVLPFKMWALCFPYKSNKEYFTDSAGNVIVGNIGLFEKIEEDLTEILKQLDGGFDAAKLPFKNKSTHNKSENYIKGNLFMKLLRLKINFDLEFYSSMKMESNRT